MRILKQFAAAFLSAALMLTLTACGDSGSTDTGEVSADSELALSVSMDGVPSALDPIYAESLTDRTILVHLYENLMRLSTDENGSTVVVNGIAKDWGHEENRDGTVTYTFHLRDDAKWSDGTAVKASDFVYAWRRLANPLSHSPHAELLSIVAGYDEARASGDMSLLQVIAKSDSLLVVNLVGHYDWFQTEVCTSSATLPLRQDVVLDLKERALESGSKGGWSGDPTALVTNGPYQASAYETNRLVLTSSHHYYGESSGPREITFLYEKAADADFSFPMSEDRIRELMAEEAPLTTTPELATHAVLFNGNHHLLGDPLIRQALSLAANRAALTELAGVTARTAEGLVPFGVPENEEGDFRTVSGPLMDTSSASYREASAQALAVLQNAGYNSGSDLGELEYLYVENGTSAAVAEAICRQWKSVLGLSVTPKGVTNQELWAALRSGEYALAEVELNAVGNDAECFLMEWTSSSQNNVIGYANTAYDTLLAIIASAPHGTARMGCLHDAETLLLGDYALLPLYTHNIAWELREGLTGLCRDARGWFYFAEVKETPLA